MPLMEKRLQLLLDARRYDLVATEARESGRSVAAVIRQSIDEHFGSRAAALRRSEAAGRFLQLTAESAPQGGQPWEQIEKDLDDDLTSYVDHKASS